MFGGVKICLVVFIIVGFGFMDMDGNLVIGNLRNNLLKFLVEGLVVNGIVFLCFDKWGIGISVLVGKEEVKFCFEDYVNDVMGWIDYLVKEKCFMIIMVVGYSEGVLIGMLVC